MGGGVPTIAFLYLLEVCACQYFVYLVTAPQRNLAEFKFLQCCAQLVGDRVEPRVLHPPAQHSHRNAAVVLNLPATQKSRNPVNKIPSSQQRADRLAG